MTALRRLFVTVSAISGALFTLASAAPALAQQSDAPVDVTAAPPPSADSVGPAQLRNFSLGGTPTRPQPAPNSGNAEPSRPAASAPPTSQPTAQQRPAATSSTPARTSEAQPQPQSPDVDLAEPTPARPAPVDGQYGGGNSATANRSVAPAVTAEASPPPTESLQAPTGSTGGIALLPWLAALAAALGAGLLFWWMRKQRQQRYNDPVRLAFAGPQPDVDVAPPPRAPIPQPPAPTPAPTPPPRADDGLIVSRALRPALTIEFQPDRLLVNDNEVAIQFDIILANEGVAPARDVLVEAILVTANANQDQQIAQFFQQPIGKGDRIAAISPLGRVALKSVVRLPLDQVNRFTVEDRELFVPLVAFNILYRSSAGEGHVSASFLVGRGTGEDVKLAPFRIEPGHKIFNGLSARSHSTGLSKHPDAA